jgi:hypothetical protein
VLDRYKPQTTNTPSPRPAFTPGQKHNLW